MKAIDLNADVGELDPELDAAIIEVVSSVSIACGGHAGDDATMERVATLAAQRKVRVGAHPSFIDRENFGRTHIAVAPDVLREQIREQIQRLAANSPVRIEYVKPHGALYHAAAVDEGVARALLAAADGLALMGQPGALYLTIGQQAGMPIIHEAFADRAYSDDGRLVPRNHPGAVLQEEAALEQVVSLTRGEVRTISGGLLTVRAQSVCLHSDTPGATALARRIADHLASEGITVTA